MNAKPPKHASSLSNAIIALGEQPDGPKTTNVAVGEAVRASKSTGGRILDGEWDKVCEQIAHAIDGPLGPAFLEAILGGSTRYRAVEVDEAARLNGDFNRDGSVDVRDVFDGGLASLGHVTETLKAAQQSEANGCLSPQDAGRIKADCLRAMDALTHVMTAAKVLTLSGGAMRVA